MKARYRINATLVAALAILVSETAYGFYNPQQGRWLSREPLGEGASISLYSYCANTPINFIDPFGLLTIHYWSPESGAFGHLSMTLDDGTYISMWPDDGQMHFGLGSEPIRTPTYALDKKEERRSPVDLYIPGLDEDKIKRWWEEWRKLGFNGRTRNCSTTVAEGLRQGIFEMPWQALYDPEETWNDINDFLGEW